MLDLEAGDALLELRGQRLVDAVHGAERGIAAGGRHFERIEHARLRRHVEIRHVGVPHRFAVAQAADRLAVHLDVGDDVDLRQAFDETAAVLLDRRPVEIAEAAAERDQILVARATDRGSAPPNARATPRSGARTGYRRDSGGRHPSPRRRVHGQWGSPRPRSRPWGVRTSFQHSTSSLPPTSSMSSQQASIALHSDAATSARRYSGNILGFHIAAAALCRSRSSK